MSLRLRVMLLTTGLVAAVALVLVLVELNTLITLSLGHTQERAHMTAQFVKRYVLDRAQRRSREAASATDLAGRIREWQEAIGSDVELPELLATTLAQTRSIVEISVADGRGLILASSNPARKELMIQPRLPLRELQELGPLDRFQAVLGGQIDYENRVDLGVESPRPGGRKEVVFTIQVLVSSVLLRDAILPELRKSALASLPLLLLAVGIAWLTAQVALFPLRGIGRAIDRIRSGEASPVNELGPARELAVVQEKLRMLGEQFRGAQEGATQLRGSVERMIEGLEESVLLFNRDGRLLACGEAVERLLQVRRQEITGKRMDELFPGDTAVGTALKAALETGAPLKETQAGRLILSMDFLPQGAVLLRLRDAEGRRMVENQLNVSTRLAAISRLTGSVAHEIKNPLNSIALRLELLRSRVLPEAPEARREIEVISQEITRLDRVVRTFLDFTRPVELRAADLDLGVLTREVAELVRPEAERAGITVETLGLEQPAPLRGDLDLLKQALMNVMRNALEAMPAGGRLAVSLGRSAEEAEVEISDTGPGIDEKIREKIFQLYYTTKKNGTGIGLAMTFRAVQLHNGSIQVAGRESGGAVIRIRLPLAAGVPA